MMRRPNKRRSLTKEGLGGDFRGGEFACKLRSGFPHGKERTPWAQIYNQRPRPSLGALGGGVLQRVHSWDMVSGRLDGRGPENGLCKAKDPRQPGGVRVEKK